MGLVVVIKAFASIREDLISVQRRLRLSCMTKCVLEAHQLLSILLIITIAPAMIKSRRFVDSINGTMRRKHLVCIAIQRHWEKLGSTGLSLDLLIEVIVVAHGMLVVHHDYLRVLLRLLIILYERVWLIIWQKLDLLVEASQRHLLHLWVKYCRVILSEGSRSRGHLRIFGWLGRNDLLIFDFQILIKSYLDART